MVPPISAVPSGSKTSRTGGREAGAPSRPAAVTSMVAPASRSEDPGAWQTRTQPSR